MIMMHSAPARHAAHRLAELFPGRVIEYEQLFEFYITVGGWRSGAWHEITGRARPAPSHAAPGLPRPALRAGPALLCPALIRLALPRVPPAGKIGRARCHMPAPPRSRAGGGFSGAGQASPAGMPMPGPTGLGPPKARLPLPWLETATLRRRQRRCPPRASTGPGPPRSPAFTLPAAAPGGSTHLSPPELRPIGERMEFMWRIPRHRGGTFRRADPNDHGSYRGRRCRRPGASGRRGRRSQADAARTRPPSPPKLVRAAQPLPCTGPRHLHMSRILVKRPFRSDLP
jgi:hypothetical protein